jgi:hypothetical protein
VGVQIIATIAEADSMSAGTSIRLEDAQFKRFFAKVESKSPKLAEKAVNVSTAATLKAMKARFLPKRTGNLRGSYQSKKLEPLANEIFTPTKYASVIEFGGRARTVHAKPGKRLTIPIKKSVLTSTGAQIKKSSLDRLFRRLKKRKKGETQWSVMQDVGIVLAKKANLPRRKGQRNIERNAKPFAEGRLFREVVRAYRSLGFK